MVFLLSRMSTKIDFCGATGRDHDGWQVAAAKETDTTSTAEAATLGDEDTGTSSGGRGNIGITMTVMTGFEDNNTVRALHRCQRWRQYDNDDHDDDNGNCYDNDGWKGGGSGAAVNRAGGSGGSGNGGSRQQSTTSSENGGGGNNE